MSGTLQAPQVSLNEWMNLEKVHIACGNSMLWGFFLHDMGYLTLCFDVKNKMFAAILHV